MTTPEVQSNRGVRVLGHALDQAADVLDHLHADQLSAATPCAEWDVATLVDHLIASPATFLAMLHGDDPDWGAPPPHIAEGWAGAFRSAADDLIHSWHVLASRHAEPATPPEWQVAEIAVHTWDLATAIGFPVDRLDPEVAETGLAFLRGALRADMRGEAFAPELAAPAGAGPYAALAAYAGRSPGS